MGFGSVEREHSVDVEVLGRGGESGRAVRFDRDGAVDRVVVGRVLGSGAAAANVPTTHFESGFRLGSWVSSQRSAYQDGRLDPERTRKLESVDGWKWNAFNAKWEEGFRALLQYVAEHHNAVVPQHHEQDGFGLGSWVSAQRKNFKKEQLSSERLTRLEALPGWTWEARSARSG